MPGLHRTGLFLLLGIFAALIACSDNSHGACDSDHGDFYVMALYSSAGLGDRGYLDNIHLAFASAKRQYGFTLENVVPENTAEAQRALARFFDGGEYSGFSQKLLVLTVDDYDSLFAGHPGWKQDEARGILHFVADSNSPDSYVRNISLYGVSYLTGAATAGLDKRAAMVLATEQSSAMREAAEGFKEGYERDGKKLDKSAIYVLDRYEPDGYASSFAYFISVLFDEYDFVYPVAGGSNLRLYRYAREYEDSIPFEMCGIDVDQQDLSPNIPFSVVKHTEKMIDEFMERWVHGKDIPQRITGTLETGHAEIVLAQNSGKWEDALEKFKERAMEAEKKYLEGK